MVVPDLTCRPVKSRPYHFWIAITLHGMLLVTADHLWYNVISRNATPRPSCSRAAAISYASLALSYKIKVVQTFQQWYTTALGHTYILRLCLLELELLHNNICLYDALVPYTVDIIIFFLCHDVLIKLKFVAVDICYVMLWLWQDWFIESVKMRMTGEFLTHQTARAPTLNSWKERWVLGNAAILSWYKCYNMHILLGSSWIHC